MAQLQQKLSNVTRVPDRSYYQKNGINTVDMYKSDVIERFTAARQGFEESVGKVKEALFFAVNRSGKDVKLPVDFTSTPITIMGENYSEKFTLPPYGFSVLKIK